VNESIRMWLVRCCWLAGLLSLGLIVTGNLWAILAGFGDDSGARFFRGGFWGLAVCWGGALVGVVGLLTGHVLLQNPPEADPAPPA